MTDRVVVWMRAYKLPRAAALQKGSREGGFGLGSAGFDADGEAVAGAEGDGEKRNDGRLGEQSEAVTLGDGGEEERCFHHREPGTDAHARAPAKGEIREARDAAGANRVDAPTLRIEAQRVWEETGVTLREPLEKEDVRAFADAVAAEIEILEGTAADAPGGRKKAKRFLDHHFGVGEAGEIGKRRRASGEDLIEFVVEGVLDGGILREEIPSPGEGVGRGFVAGEKEGHDFVAKLEVVHAAAVFVVGV